jgi:MFS family permease
MADQKPDRKRTTLFSSYAGMSKEAKYLVYSSIWPSIAYGLFYADISYFLTEVQGLSPQFMGLVLTLMGVSAVTASIPLGIAADKYGRKKLLILGNVIASSIIAVFALTTNATLLISAAVFEGISEAAFSASSGALLAEKVEASKRNSAFSLYGFAQSTAFGIGGMAIWTVSIFRSFGFNTKESHVLLYVALAALSLASTLIMLRITESKNLKKPGGGVRGLLPHRSKGILVKYVLTSAIIAFGAGMVVPLMAFWMGLRYGISDVTSVFILGISSIVIGIATLASTPLAKRFGLVKAAVATQAFSTFFMFATPLSPDYISASFVYTARAFLMNMASPLQQSMIMGLVAEDERGAASGVSAALWRLPNALSTSIGTWFMSRRLLATPFYIATALYILSIGLFWYFFRNTIMPEERTKRPKSPA